MINPTPACSILPSSEEPRIAYDRVHLSSYFSHHTAEELSLVREGFYEKHGVKVLVGERAITINRQEKVIHSSAGRTVFYDKLIMATGSYPWIPPIKGSETQDCFVYRTIEDLNAIEACARRSKRGAVVGGGLLGLEAAGALKNLGVETHVIEFAPMLMAEQLDQMGGEQLRRKIESMGVRVHTSKNTKEIVQEGTEARKTMRFADGSELEVDFIVFSTGIRPRDKLATQCGLEVAPRGGIVINDACQTSDPDIYAIGECASWNNRVYGLVAPGYKMAQVTVDHILQTENAFEGADLSAKLKLLGVDVGGIGDAHGRTPGARSYVYLDESKEVYKRLIVSPDNKTLLGAVLVGDTSDYGNLLQLVLNAIELPENPDSLILPAHAGSGKPSIGVDKLPDSAQICSCFDVTKGALIAAINKGCHTVAALKAETKAGTGCGGCIPLVTQVLNAELAKQGIEVNNNLCEHFAYSVRNCSTSSGWKASKPLKSCWRNTVKATAAKCVNRPWARCWLPAGTNISSSRSIPRCRIPTTTSWPTSRKTAPTPLSRALRAAKSRRKAWWPSAVSPANLICTPRSPALSVSACSARKRRSAGNLASADRRGLRNRSRVCQGAADGENLRRQHLVPLRRRRQRGFRRRTGKPLQRHSYAA